MQVRRNIDSIEFTNAETNHLLAIATHAKLTSLYHSCPKCKELIDKILNDIHDDNEGV